MKPLQAVSTVAAVVAVVSLCSLAYNFIRDDDLPDSASTNSALFYRGSGFSHEPYCLPKDVYEVVKSDEKYGSSFHKYTRVDNLCKGQSYFEGVPQDTRGLDWDKIKRNKNALQTSAAGLYDYTEPPLTYFTINRGHATFPSSFDCGEGAIPTKGGLPRVFLSTMVPVMGFRGVMLSQFIKHYKGYGVQGANMLFTLHITKNSTVEVINSIISMLEEEGVYYDTYVGDWSSEALMYHQAHKLLACTTASDWIIVADADEFHAYPSKNVAAFFQSLDKDRINAVQGYFIDRLHKDGKLVPIQEGIPMQEQFPVGCQLHNSFQKGTPKKAMAFRGFHRINRGHHRFAPCTFWAERHYLHLFPGARCPTHFPAIRVAQKTLKVHHFKWIEGQLESAKLKIQGYSEQDEVRQQYVGMIQHLEKYNGVCVKCRENACVKEYTGESDSVQDLKKKPYYEAIKVPPKGAGKSKAQVRSSSRGM